MHKYPRKIMRRGKDGTPQTFADADYLIIEKPGAPYTGWKYGALGTPDYMVFSESPRNSEFSADLAIEDGSWMDVIEHGKEIADVEQRCAIVYLKGIVKELRDKLRKVEASREGAAIGDSEAHQMLIKALFGTSADRREVKRELKRRGASVRDLAKIQ